MQYLFFFIGLKENKQNYSRTVCLCYKGFYLVSSQHPCFCSIWYVRVMLAMPAAVCRQELVQFFVVSDGELKMSWDDSCLLVVSGSVTSQLQDFSGQVLEDGSQVDWSS